jgi:competence protein ComEA
MMRPNVVSSAVALALFTMTLGGLSVVQAAQEPRAAVSNMLPLNLNTASAAELEKLPGVGPAMALRIVEYRQKSGGFKRIEELMNVKGIGEKSFLKLKPQITVSPGKVAER